MVLISALLISCGGDDMASTSEDEVDCEIAFAGDLPDEPAGHRLYCVNADGSGLHPLTSAPDEMFAAGAYEAFPSWSPDGSRVAFTRMGSDGGLFVMNADGSDERRIIGGYAHRSDWSPDGTRLTFMWLAQGLSADPGAQPRAEVVVVDADGSDLLNISDHPALPGEATADSFPLWSPDGTQILFHHEADTTPGRSRVPQSGLYIVNADGSDPRQVDTGAIKVFLDVPENTWSPDGRSLTVRGGLDPDDPEAEGIYEVPLDGSPSERLTPVELSPVSVFDWSPDGGRLAFAAFVSSARRAGAAPASNVDLFVFESRSGNVRAVAETPETLEWAPIWSPDEQQLLHVSFPSSEGVSADLLKNFRIAVMNADGTNATVIVDGFSVETEPWWPAWRPPTDSAPSSGQ